MAPGSSRSLAQTSRASPYACSASSSFSFRTELTRVVCQLPLRSCRPRSSWNFDFGMDAPSPPPPHRVPSAHPRAPRHSHTPTDTHTPLPSLLQASCYRKDGARVFSNIPAYYCRRKDICGPHRRKRGQAMKGKADRGRGCEAFISSSASPINQRLSGDQPPPPSAF